MTDYSKLVDSILAVAEKVAPMVFPQAAVAIEAGKAVVDLIDKAKGIVGETDAARLNEGREAFELRVAANVGEAANVLRGE